MYAVEPSPLYRKQYRKLLQRDRVLAISIAKKIAHIATYPEHYKPLRASMKGFRRAHFGSYVLIFRFRNETVELIALEHHDDAYMQYG